MGVGLRTRWRQSGILLQIAFRNLFASRLKTVIVGGIVLFGTVLVVVGSSLTGSMLGGVERSVQGSLGGHVQVYSARSREDLALYGTNMGTDSELEPVPDFAALKKTLLSVPNVKTVVPLGIRRNAFINGGNPLDLALEKIRADVRSFDAGERTAERAGQYEAHKAHARRIVTLMRRDLEGARKIADLNGRDAAERHKEWEDLTRATEDGFWSTFDRDPKAALEFLENRVAPQNLDGAFLPFRYVGTDLDAFAQAFDRMEIVEGTKVPTGRRGVLLGRYYWEEFLKLHTARRLDKIREARARNAKIAIDPDLKRWVKENTSQTREILQQLDPIQERVAVERLQGALGSKATDLKDLLVELLSTDDGNFERRYQIFYRDLAPLLNLYSVKVGDTLTIKAASGGYMKSVNVKVYGIYEFKGLANSPIAGFMSLMDLMTFRDLFGFRSAAQAQEIARLKAGAGARAVDRERAEAELFGGGGESLVDSGRTATIDESKMLAGGGAARLAKDEQTRVYGQDEIDGGVALNAAVILKDPRRLREALRDIPAAGKRDGLDLKAVTWLQASGSVGALVMSFKFILVGAVIVIFSVALVIINNAMVMATLQRVKEIGTLRAIGTQRRFILFMMLVESVAVGLFFGVLGVLTGVGILQLVRAFGGIGARTDQMRFFFSGPSLMPTLSAGSVAGAFAIVFLVSILSGLYPARLAMRVTPLEAMQSDD